MKILKHGETTKKFTCAHCWCKFIAEKGEYHTTEYSRPPIFRKPYFYVALCPECGRMCFREGEFK